jgi:hypothetical protein
MHCGSGVDLSKGPDPIRRSVHASGVPFFRSPTVRMPAVMARSAHCRAACQNISLCWAQQKRFGEPPRRGVSGWRHHREHFRRCRGRVSAGQGFPHLTVCVHRASLSPHSVARSHHLRMASCTGPQSGLMAPPPPCSARSPTASTPAWAPRNRAMPPRCATSSATAAGRIIASLNVRNHD